MTTNPQNEDVATWMGPKSRPVAPIRWINRLCRSLGKFINLDDSYLIKRALHKYPDFPVDRIEFRDELRVLANAFEHEANLNFFGRISAQQDTIRLIRTQIRILKELDRHPEVAYEQIHRPIFVVGLPRTGTTILLALLAQDPAHRPLLFYKGINPVPPRNGPDRRLQKAHGMLRIFNLLSPNYQSIHPMHADLPEECVLLFMNIFSTPQIDFFYEVPSYINLLREKGLRDAYQRYRDQLRLLQWYDGPGPSEQHSRRWVLKDPAHLLGLEHILELFPDACIIQTHRDPLKSVPSNCSLYAHSRIMFSDKVDASELGAYVAEGIWPEALDTALKSREQLPNQNFFDLRYVDFMEDPIRSMESIYRYFGFELSESSKEAMSSYLHNHPRAGNRVHSYSLEQFGLSAEEQSKRYEAYRTHFDIPSEH